MKTVRTESYKLAIRDLTEFIVNNYSRLKFKVSDKTTNNFDGFKSETERNGGIITVSLEGCETSIYGNMYINLLARLWHDKLHLKYNKDFSVAHEVFIADLQRDAVYSSVESKYGHDRAINASVLIWIDIYEQIMYYNKYLQFVDNQEQFVYDKFLEYTGGN